VFTLGIGCPIYYQHHLNRVWATMRTVPSVSDVAAHAAV
jgi:hypothetical protein